jgi:hypothetical protein
MNRNKAEVRQEKSQPARKERERARQLVKTRGDAISAPRAGLARHNRCGLVHETAPPLYDPPELRRRCNRRATLPPTEQKCPKNVAKNSEIRGGLSCKVLRQYLISAQHGSYV